MGKTAYKRINITLPERTLKRLDRATRTGDRSRLIDTAVNLYLGKKTREELRKALEEEAREDSSRNLAFAEETLDLGDLWE